MRSSSESGVQVIARAAAILRAVTAQPEAMSLGQLAAATGLARSTVQRIVDALEAEHLVQAGAGGVRPGWGLRRMGDAAGPEAARTFRPYLFQLFEATGMSVDLSTLWDGEVLFLDRFMSPRHERLLRGDGARHPAYTMANGKALLATLSDDDVKSLYGDAGLPHRTPCTLRSVSALLAELAAIRAGGFAYDREEHGEGLSAIGMAVQADGVPLAVSVVVPDSRFNEVSGRIESALSACRAAYRQAAEANG